MLGAEEVDGEYTYDTNDNKTNYRCENFTILNYIFKSTQDSINFTKNIEPFNPTATPFDNKKQEEVSVSLILGFQKNDEDEKETRAR